MEYLEFKLRARDWADGRFFVEVLESPVGQMNSPDASVYDPALDPLLDRLGETMERWKMSWQDLREVGVLLAGMLFPERVRAWFDQSMQAADEQGKGLRIRLVMTDPELARLPWEYVYLKQPWEHELDAHHLFDKGHFLALNVQTPIARYQPLEEPLRVRTVRSGHPLRVFVGFSEPRGEFPLDLSHEREAIRSDLQALAERGWVLLHIDDHLTADELLAEARDKHIFHYSGHGTYTDHRFIESSDGGSTGGTTGGASHIAVHVDAPASIPVHVEYPEAAPAPADTPARHLGGPDRPLPPGDYEQGVLGLEDADGNLDFFTGDQLALVLRGTDVRIVIMDACKSAKRDAHKIWTGIAPALMRAGIPAAVGMQFSIGDTSAIDFSGSIYEAIAAGLPLEEALTHARIQISINDPQTIDGQPQNIFTDWGLPVLYLAAPHGAVFSGLTADEALHEKREDIRGRIRSRHIHRTR